MLRLTTRTLCAGAVAMGLSGATEAMGNDPPYLASFAVEQIAPGTYALEGYVDDEFRDECVVWFGGAAQGAFAICDSDGRFNTYVDLGPYDTGAVTAQAFDNLDQGSNVREDVIFY